MAMPASPTSTKSGASPLGGRLLHGRALGAAARSTVDQGLRYRTRSRADGLFCLAWRLSAVHRHVWPGVGESDGTCAWALSLSVRPHVGSSSNRDPIGRVATNCCFVPGTDITASRSRITRERAVGLVTCCSSRLSRCPEIALAVIIFASLRLAVLDERAI